MKSFLSASLLLIAATTMAQAPQEVEFSYSDGRSPNWVGTGQPADYDVAIKLDDPDFTGLKVVGAKIFDLYGDADGVTDYKIWVASELGKPMETKPATLNDVHMGAVTFDQAPVLTADGLFIGFSCHVAKAETNICQYPIPYTAPANVPNSMWLQFNGQGWTDYSDQYGCATIIVYLQGENIRSNALAIAQMSSSGIASKDKPVKVTYTLIKNATETINNIEYTYTLNGQTETKAGNITIQGPSGSRVDVDFTLPALDKVGTYPLDFAITKVNGVANSSTHNSLHSTIIIEPFTVTKHPVMEEGTGTWCGWCPRGWLAMRDMKKKYPGFIGIAYHNGDVMAPKDDTPARFTGYPGAFIDRAQASQMDPYYGSTMQELGIQYDYLDRAATPGYANISITTKWNADSTSLDVRPELTFSAVPPQECKLGYVLIANGICHPDDGDYKQLNFFHNKTDQPSFFAYLVGLPNPITDMQFDEVAVNTEAAKGLAGTLPSEIKIETPYKDRYVFDTSSFPNDDKGEIDCEKKNIEVVVLLIGANDGKILNGAKCEAGKMVGIEQTVRDSEQADGPVVYYNLQGQRVNNPQHGIFIRQAGTKATKVALD